MPPKGWRKWSEEEARLKKNARAYVRIQERRKLVADLKVKAGCVDCGYDDSPYALDFDHVRGDKVAGVAQLMSGTLDRLLEEIAKCVVRCANCHRVKTWGDEKGCRDR